MKNSSKLLFNEEPITINRLAAKVLGLNEAIVVQQVHYWLEINRKAKINLYDNRTWTYNTYEKWQNENFDFWSTRTVMRIFVNLFDKGIFIRGNYNKKKYDKTTWVSIDYDKLDEILEEYERNVEISTKCQVVTKEETLEFQQSDKLSPSIVTSCHQAKCQVVTNYTRDYTENNTEISITTQSEQNVPVVETNKELIESKTHLLLDSKNKIDKVAKWNKDRLVKAIDIFVEQGGQYFSLLEKIYKDDKNFVPEANKEKKPLTRFHNINNTFEQYTEDELNEKIKKSQADKFDNPITDDFIIKSLESEEYYNSLSPITKTIARNNILKSSEISFIPDWIK